MKTRKVLPPTYFLVSIVAMVVLNFLFPVSRIITLPWNFLGFFPLGFGIFLNLAADQSFRHVHTTVKPFEESSVLVTNGVFQISRNPMYLGFVLTLIGLAVLLGSLTPLAVVFIFAVLIDRKFVTLEEQMLAKKFNKKWQRYQQNTRRWL